MRKQVSLLLNSHSHLFQNYSKSNSLNLAKIRTFMIDYIIDQTKAILALTSVNQTAVPYGLSD